MKNEIGIINATPSKRLYLSIIADYDINKSICELVDNAIDVWTKNGKTKKVNIRINLEKTQQTIKIEDNAGGLKNDELVYVVGPGQTGTNPEDETIGIFGVGTKRAVVALAQEIEIRTRFNNEKTYQIDINDSWLEDDEWELPYYEVNEILEGTTIIELKKLRIPITDEVIVQLKSHLCATYAKFIKSNSINIEVNNVALTPIFFDNWAYPPDYGPIKYYGMIKGEENTSIKVEVYAGLTLESSPAAGEYGVYFYCNDRLVGRALKSFDVGFIKGYAGLPHPKVSLTRVLVNLNGDARSMPWNSSKSDINTKHYVFIAIHDWLIRVVKDYASLSRIWMGDWKEKVFRYKSGKITEIEINDFPKLKKTFLPPLPKTRINYVEKISAINKPIIASRPWVRGLYESIIAIDLILKQRSLEQKNRIAMIVLDSTIEIAFKEFLVNESGNYYSNEKLLSIFKNTHSLQEEVKKYNKFDEEFWRKINHYHNLRCSFVHERASVGISDDEIEGYRSIVENALNRLFDLKFD